MNFFISRLISILITLSIVVGSASADLDGLTAARRRPEDINPGWSVSQVIRQAFASRALWVGRFIVPSLGVVRHRAQDQIPRSPGGNLRRPGRIQSRILRWLLVFTPLGGQRPNLRDLHDELSKQIGTYLTDWDKEEWEGTLRELAGRDVVIVRNADASSVLTPIGNGAGAYVPLAQWNGKTIQLKESLFRIEPHLLRNIVLAFVLAHELSEIWIVEHPGRWKTRFLTALGGLLSPSQPLEMAAHILLWASASHMKPLLRGLRDVVYTPALSLRAVLPIHHAQTDDEGLVEKAYDLAQAEYRGASNLPSGMNYFAEVTREASVITTMNLPAAATVALLLRHLRPERLDPLERLLGIGQDQADDIRNLIAGLGRMTRNAWNPKLVAGKPTYAVQNFTNRAIKVTGEIATQLAESRRPESAEAGPLAARLQPSLLAMMFADRCVVLETVDLRNRPLLVRRLYDQILTVWSPLAERLGVQDVAERLADEALRFKYPAEYSHVKRARDVALGLTDEQEQAELGYMRGRLAAVARAAQLGADSFTVTGRAKGIFSLREKWLFRSQTKKKSDEPTWEINQSLDLLAYRIVVDNPREMDRLRHALGNGLSTPERPIQRLEEGREIARDSKGNIILEKFNVRYANPYDTTKTITAEVQVMTRGYFPTYLSGRSMARFYLGHWMMKAKRVVDNRLRGRSVPELALGEQFDHQDPPLTGDFSADVLAAAESLEPFEFPAVVGGVEAPDVAESEFDVLKLRKQNRYRRATRRHRKSKEARPDLNEEPLIADAAFHPTVGGRPSEYPQAVELPPAAADPSARQRPIPRSLWDPVSSSQMLWLNPTHTGKLDDAEYARLRDAVASASACLALMEGPGNQQEHLNELEREGRDLLRPRFGDPDDPEVQKQVLRPAMASLGIPLDRPDRLYQALALSDRHERKKFTADQSQFVPLHDDFQKWVDLNFVTRLASVEREPSAVKIVETIDESQVGVLAGDVATISGQGWNIRGFQQRQISELQYQIIYELDSGPGWTDGPSEAALRQLERALKLKQLRRGENPPPDGGRWLDIHVHFPPALAPKPGVLASAVQRLADKKVDVRSGRLQDLDLTLRVLAPAELARDKGAALVELLTMGGLADYVSVQSSPLSEATIDVLQQMVIEERERIEQLYNLDLRELGREPMSGLQARAPAPDDVVDEDAVGFFHQAGRLAAQWFGIGAYKPGEAFVHVKMRSDGKIPYFIHLLGVVRVVINEGRVRDMPAIIAWLLHDIFEEGPENAWAFIEPLLLQVAGYRSDEAWPSDRLAEWNKVLAEFPDMLGPLQQVLSALRSSSPAERDIRGLLAPLKADFLRIAEQKIRADIRRKFPEYADDILRRLDLYTRNPSESYAHYFDRVMRGDASDRIGKYADRYNNLLDLPERLRAADAELKTPVTEERRRQLNAFVAWASRYVEETVRFYLPAMPRIALPRELEERFLAQLAPLVAQLSEMSAKPPAIAFEDAEFRDHPENRPQAEQRLKGQLAKSLKRFLKNYWPDVRRRLPPFEPPSAVRRSDSETASGPWRPYDLFERALEGSIAELSARSDANRNSPSPTKAPGDQGGVPPGSGDFRAAHLPLVISRPAAKALSAVKGTSAYKRIVNKDMGFARVTKNGRIKVERPALRILTPTVNDYRADRRLPPLSDDDVERILVEHEQSHLDYRQHPMIAKELLSKLPEPGNYDSNAGSPIGGFDDLRTYYANNYGERYKDPELFVEELFLGRRLHTALLGDTVHVVTNRDDPLGTRLELPPRIGEALDAVWEEWVSLLEEVTPEDRLRAASGFPKLTPSAARLYLAQSAEPWRRLMDNSHRLLDALAKASAVNLDMARSVRPLLRDFQSTFRRMRVFRLQLIPSREQLSVAPDESLLEPLLLQRDLLRLLQAFDKAYQGFAGSPTLDAYLPSPVVELRQAVAPIAAAVGEITALWNALQPLGISAPPRPRASQEGWLTIASAAAAYAILRACGYEIGAAVVMAASMAAGMSAFHADRHLQRDGRRVQAPRENLPLFAWNWMRRGAQEEPEEAIQEDSVRLARFYLEPGLIQLLVGLPLVAAWILGARLPGAAAALGLVNLIQSATLALSDRVGWRYLRPQTARLAQAA